MRLKQEAMAEAIRSIEQAAERHSKIQAALEAAVPVLSAGLNPVFSPKVNSRRCWKAATLKAIYGNDSLT